MRVCHHRSYDWLGRELEDPFIDDPARASVCLLCDDCHKYVHLRSDYDPARVPTLAELAERVRNFRA